MIKIIGLGPGDKSALTLGAVEELQKCKNVYFRTAIHPTVEHIKNMGVKFETYDNKYESKETFDEVYQSIAEDLIDRYKEQKDVVYAVPGHPLVAEKSVNILIDLCKENNIGYEILPAVSFVDAVMEAIKVDPVEGMKIIDAFDIHNQVLDKRVGTIITQVYDPYISSEVKLALGEYYGDDFEIYFVRAAGVKGLESIRKIKVYEIDRQEDIDYLTSLYIPKGNEDVKDFNDLLSVMSILRGEDGCPWDIKQTHESIKKCLIEECYETIEAIDEEDENKLIEELGDVLLQVVFHAQIGKDDGYFNINDVIQGITNKLITRHPHIFGNIDVEDANEVLENWDAIKKKEQGHETHTEVLKHVSKSLPALIRAKKVQEKAAKVGFDWDNVEPAMDKVLEEIKEVKDVYKSKNRVKILEEIGDLIFACVNVARFLDIDPEDAVNYTIEKFIKRFQFIEESAIEKGYNLEEMTLSQMDELWEKAKVIKKI